MMKRQKKREDRAFYGCFILISFIVKPCYKSRKVLPHIWHRTWRSCV